MSKFVVKAAGLTDQGKTRGNNEDAIWVDVKTGLLIVADGMGGHNAGEVASRMAVTTIPENFSQLTKANTSGEVSDPRFSTETNRLGFCVKVANQMIFEASKRYPQDHGMGTTCTAILIKGDRLSLAHVGDSRCYLIRRGDMEQLTQDHSLVMEQVRHGLLSINDEAVHTGQNILTRSLGTEEKVKIDVDEHPLFPGDVLLLCSDGLGKEMTDAQILEVVNRTPNPSELVKSLIDQCNASGGRDNITVAVARIEKVGLAASIMSFFGR
jgi:serine/threonine protein phosphatase PrpC